MHQKKICLIEDDAIMGESISDRLLLEGYAVDWFQQAKTAFIALTTHSYALVISDIRLPDETGDQLFQRLLDSGYQLPPFVFMTGYGDVNRAVSLIKMGALDYITKPFDFSELLDNVREAIPIGFQAHSSEDVQVTPLGRSSAMRHIYGLLPRIAMHASTVLITGESGVGKEYVAKALHQLSGNRDTPFIAVNCAAISANLVESELFGHEKGAFTDAIRTKKGAFEQAIGGTLFLDEIGEAPLSLQAKLLRVIQERYIVRVGGEKPIPVQVRLVLATHRDLAAMVAAGQFREDLYYRVQVIQLKVPALRERRDDILHFAQQFLEDYAQRHQEAVKQLPPLVARGLVGYDWPGNLRQLYNAIERACILNPEQHLTLCDFPDVFQSSARPDVSQAEMTTCADLADYIADCERVYIATVLTQHDWQMSKTAERLGISRKNLWEKMKKLGIHSPTAV